MADDQTQVVKQPPNNATWSRSTTVGVGIPISVTGIIGLEVYGFQIIQYFSPGFPIITDPVVLGAIAGVITGAFGFLASWVMRGTTVAKDTL